MTISERIRGAFMNTTDDEVPPPPPIATLPERVPEFSDQDHDKEIAVQAALMVAQYKRDREASARRESELQVQLTEAVLSRQGDANKINFLELENAELRNNIQTLQTDVIELRTLWSKVREILDRFGIKAPEKKPREKKARKKERATS